MVSILTLLELLVNHFKCILLLNYVSTHFCQTRGWPTSPLPSVLEVNFLSQAQIVWVDTWSNALFYYRTTPFFIIMGWLFINIRNSNILKVHYIIMDWPPNFKCLIGFLKVFYFDALTKVRYWHFWDVWWLAFSLGRWLALRLVDHSHRTISSCFWVHILT